MERQLEIIGSGVSIGATVVALTFVIVPDWAWAVIDRLEARWKAWRSPVAVCRGCGLPVPVGDAHRRAGVPFCSALCAHDHPSNHPEEIDP